MPKAAAVSATPSSPPPWYTPVMTTAIAVSMHTPMESTSGSHRAVNPSVAGSFVFEALWAMPAEPTPAALENSARWMPMTATPMMPPVTPSAVKALVKIVEIAVGSASMFTRMIASAQST